MAKCKICAAEVGCSCKLRDGMCSNCKHKEELKQQKIQLINTPIHVTHSNSN